MIRTGDRVRVSGARGSVNAVVEDVRPVADLPDELPGLTPGFGPIAKELLLGELVTHVAVIAYEYNGAKLVFVVMRHEAGTWWDLQYNLLIIEPIAATQDVLFDTAPRPN